MDVSSLTLEETETLISQAHARIEQIRLASRTAQDERTTRIEDSIEALDQLLGAEDAEPGVDSIRAVRGYTGEDMAANAAVAFPLAFEGLEILTRVVRDVASTIAKNPAQ